MMNMIEHNVKNEPILFGFADLYGEWGGGTAAPETGGGGGGEGQEGVQGPPPPNLPPTQGPGTHIQFSSADKVCPRSLDPFYIVT